MCRSNKYGREEVGSKEFMIYEISGKSKQRAREDLGNQQSSLRLARGAWGLNGFASTLDRTRLVWACPAFSAAGNDWRRGEILCLISLFGTGASGRPGAWATNHRTRVAPDSSGAGLKSGLLVCWSQAEIIAAGGTSAILHELHESFQILVGSWKFSRS
jgi:hypothetical protein